MKKYVIALALVANNASAREASIDIYAVDEPAGFSLLVPGAVEAQADIPVDETELVSRLDLAVSFANLSPDVTRAMEASLEHPAEAVYVPSWMRGKRNPFAGYVRPSILRVGQPGCLTTAYAPVGGISHKAEARRRLYFRDMVTAACEAGVPVDLFDSVVLQESRYNPRARSSAGAIGMAQLMPGTANYLGVANPWDVRENLSGGARYLREQLDEFGSWHLALSAYNAGPAAVRRFSGIPPYSETQQYVRSVLHRLAELSGT